MMDYGCVEVVRKISNIYKDHILIEFPDCWKFLRVIL